MLPFSTSAKRVTPSSSSQTAGSAALTRLESQEGRGHVSRPLGGGSGGPLVVARGDVAGKEVKKKTCSQLPDRSEPIPMEVVINECC